jgi:AcrR family transcriptional regulator
MPRAPETSAPPTARRTQTDRRQESEAKLLEAARQIVARKGWTGMTLAEVGEAAGVSRGLAAHYFGSKAGLQRALATYIHERFMAQVRALPELRPGLASLRAFVSTYLGRQDWTNTRALLLLMTETFIEDSGAGDGIDLYNHQVVGWLQAQFQQGIEAGEIRPEVDAYVSGALLMGSLRGVMLHKFSKNATLDVQAVCRQLLDMLDRSYAIPARRSA